MLGRREISAITMILAMGCSLRRELRVIVRSASKRAGWAGTWNETFAVEPALRPI